MSTTLTDKNSNGFPARSGVAAGDFISSAEMNQHLDALGERTNYLYTMGIYPHNTAFAYPIDAFCQVSGVVYRAAVANTGKPPVSNPSIWTACPMTAAEISAALNFVTALNGKQDADNTLTALANLATSADKMIYATGADQFALTPLTAFIRTLLDDGDADAARVTLGAAPLVSPALTGTPTAPTAALGTNTNQLATTAFVNAEIAADRPYEATVSNIKMNGTQAVGTSNAVARGDHVHPTDTSRAPLASPALTGTPTAPTAAVGTSTTQIATMAAVQAELSAQKYVSPELAMSNGGQIVVNHGLGVEPTHISLYLKCAVAEFGYAVGDVIRIAGESDPNGPNEAIGVLVNNAQIVLRVGESGPQLITRKDNGSGAASTAANWRLIVKATK